MCRAERRTRGVEAERRVGRVEVRRVAGMRVG